MFKKGDEVRLSIHGYETYSPSEWNWGEYDVPKFLSSVGTGIVTEIEHRADNDEIRVHVDTEYGAVYFFPEDLALVSGLEQQYSDGDVCLYGERQVVIIGEPNREKQSAQIVDYPFAEDWQFQVETRPLGHLGMVLWNRFEKETKAPCDGLNGTEQAVHSPQHYDLFDGTEAIEVIASALTQEEFRGYCFGNLLKYRLRAGKKDDVVQELMKADKYKELYENYKHLCKED